MPYISVRRAKNGLRHPTCMLCWMLNFTSMGTGIEMRPGELHNDAFIRYCEEHEMTYKGVGVWMPPERKDNGEVAGTDCSAQSGPAVSR